MTDPLGQSQVLPYLSGLSKHGFEFHLISFEKNDRYKQHRKHIQRICDNSGIHWHPQDYSHQGGLKKTIRQVRRMLKVSHYLYKKHHFEIVHCRSYIAALTGVSLKKKYGSKFVFDMRGFWADERVEGGLWNLGNPLYKQIYNYFKRKEKSFIHKADAIVSLTANGKSEIEDWKFCDPNKITVIPCCVDLERFDPENTSHAGAGDIRSNLGIDQDTFVLGYVGSIGTWYMLDEMLDFYVQLRSIKKKAHFLFLTNEPVQSVLSAAEKKGITKKETSVLSVLHHEVPHYISSLDASIFFIRPTFSKKASSPTKQGEIMAMGVPIVCNTSVGDTDLIVKEYHAGALVEEFNNEAYLRAIVDLKTFVREDAIHGAVEFYSLEKGVNNYFEVYQSLLK